MTALDNVSIVGIGMHPFGRTAGMSGRQQGAVAIRAALADAGIAWTDVDFVAGGSDSAGKPDTLVSDLGLTGVPFINVLNGCATGGSALTAAAAMVSSGGANVAVVVGFDKHPRGAFSEDPRAWGLPDWYGTAGMMVTSQFFAMKLQRYMHDYGVSRQALARVSAKAFRNGSLNANAWRRDPLTIDQILDARMISDPLTQYMFCSPGEGAVSLVLTRRNKGGHRSANAVHLSAVTMKSRRFGSFEVYAPYLAAERTGGPSVDAAATCFDEAGIAPSDIDLAQIQDTESGAEIMHMAETGLCEHGEQEGLLAAGATEIGGQLPINTDGGCLANGEPIGASGLRQVYENVLQLRGDAGTRQVPNNPKTAFTHVYGAPGVSACTVMTR